MTGRGKKTRGGSSGKASWRKWGPYLSERQWGTVREDYSEMGTHGIISLTINPDREPIVGEKMESRDL